MIRIRPTQCVLAALTMGLILMVCGPRQLPAPPPAAIQAGFRGSDEAILAQGPGFRISEKDMFQFVLMTEVCDPDLVVRWRALNETEKPVLLGNIDLYLMMLFNVEQAPKESTPGEVALGLTAERINAGPAAELLWADYVVRESVSYFPEDIAYFYKRFPERFAAPGMVSLQRLRVPIPANATKSERDAAEARVESLRQEAATHGGLGPLLEKYPDLLIDPPGRVFEVTKGDTTVDSQLIDTAFRLGVSQISSPIRTPGGYLLIEVVDRKEGEARSVNDALSEIETELSWGFVPQQFDYMMNKLMVKMHPVNRIDLFQFMPDDADLLRVKDFALSLGDFKKLYPELIGDMKEPNKPVIAFKATNIIMGEIATQELEDRGLLDDPFYQSALDLADTLQLSATYLRGIRDSLQPADEEVSAFLAANLERIDPGPAYEIWRYELRPRDEREMTPGEIDSLRIVMESYLKTMVQDAGRQFEERLQIDPERGIADPAQVIKALRQPPDLRVKMTFEKEGGLTLGDAKARFGLPVDTVLEKGKFTAPLALRDGRVVSYFVSDIVPGPPISEEELMQRARAQYIIDKSIEGSLKRLNALKESGDLKLAPELTN